MSAGFFTFARIRYIFSSYSRLFHKRFMSKMYKFWWIQRR